MAGQFAEPIAGLLTVPRIGGWLPWLLLSNHVTAVQSVEGPFPANAYANWASFVFGEVAKVAKALHGLEGEIWESRRYRLIEIDDDTVLRTRMKYALAQAPAAGLVARPAHWPGVNTCDATCRGGALRGYRGSAALRRRARLKKVPIASIAPARIFAISPLPSQATWNEPERQSWHRQLEREVIAEAAAERGSRAHRQPDAYRTVCPHTVKALRPSDAPRIYAEDGRAAWRRWRAKMSAFTDAWREALATWIDGSRPCFPTCGWVPYGACYAPGYVLRA